MQETQTDRTQRFNYAIGHIAFADPKTSFANIIGPNREVFREFKVVYSSENINSDFFGISLREIEDRFPVLSKYFYGTCLLFFSDSIYDRTLEKGQAKISLDCRLFLDSNVAEKFRVFENGGNLGDDEKRFELLVHFLKGIGENGFNYDYAFFVMENLEYSLDLNNHRPFNTVRALKRFESLIYHSSLFEVKHPQFNTTRKSAGERAAETLHWFQSNSEIQNLLFHQKVIYLILLKSVEVYHRGKGEISDKLKEIILFVLEQVGKITKSELYFAWKLLKYGKRLRFFFPIVQPSIKLLHRVRGMSWDLYTMRYLEAKAATGHSIDFLVPFFSTFNIKLRELMKACPVRAMIIDSKYKIVNTIFFDEMEFQEDMRTAVSKRDHSVISSSGEQVKRMSFNVDRDKIICKIKELEETCQLLAGNF